MLCSSQCTSALKLTVTAAVHQRSPLFLKSLGLLERISKLWCGSPTIAINCGKCDTVTPPEIMAGHVSAPALLSESCAPSRHHSYTARHAKTLSSLLSPLLPTLRIQTHHTLLDSRTEDCYSFNLRVQNPRQRRFLALSPGPRRISIHRRPKLPATAQWMRHS